MEPVAAFALPLVLACGGAPPPAAVVDGALGQTATGQAVVSEPRPLTTRSGAHDDDVAPHDPRFVSARDARIHASLVAWIAANSADFVERPELRLGNFVSRMRCRGATSSECDGGAIVNSERRGTAWRRLDGLTYDDAKSLFGVLVSVGDFPSTGDFGVRLSLIETSTVAEQRLVGEGLWLSFARFDGDVVKERLAVGTTASWVHREASGGGVEEIVMLAPSMTWKEALSALSLSPASLARFVRGQEDRLLLEARARIEDGRIHGFDEGPYEGNGLPPELTPRALTTVERAAALAALAAEHARRLAFVDRHQDALHRLVVSRLPSAALLAAP